nr:SurA N-terminal domain-containing protein [Aquibacillus sediminis]
MKKKWIMALSLSLSVFGLAACNGGDDAAEENNEETNTQEETPAENNEEMPEGAEGNEQPEMPEADLDGVPDVVATVNGQEISGEEFKTNYEAQFQQAAMQSQMTGEEVDQDQLKQQLVEGMVGQELLIQEADNRDYTASDEALDETLDELVQQNGLESTDEFIAALEEQGMDEQEVMTQLETQVKVDQFIADEAGEFEPTEEELQEAYEQVKAQQEQMGGEQELPSFDELRPDLEQQLISQKESEYTQTLIEELREGADVSINL